MVERIYVDRADGSDATSEGWITEGGKGYVKSTKAPYGEMFSGHQEFILIRAWPKLKDREGLEWIEMRDVVSHIRYRISVEDARRYGEMFVWPSKLGFYQPETWRVPTKWWTIHR